MQESVSIRLKAQLIVPQVQKKDADERTFWTIATSQVVDTQKEIIDMKYIKALLPVIKARGMAVNLGHFGINVGHTKGVWLKTFGEIIQALKQKAFGDMDDKYRKNAIKVLSEYNPKTSGLVAKGGIYKGNNYDDIAWKMLKNGNINGSSVGLDLVETGEVQCDTGGCGRVMKAGSAMFELALTGKGLDFPIKSYDPSNPTSLILGIKAQQERAPKGGITLGGKQYKGGEFIPKEVMEDLSDKDKKKLEQAKKPWKQRKKPKEEESRKKPKEEESRKKPHDVKLTDKEKKIVKDGLSEAKEEGKKYGYSEAENKVNQEWTELVQERDSARKVYDKLAKETGFTAQVDEMRRAGVNVDKPKQVAEFRKEAKEKFRNALTEAGRPDKTIGESAKKISEFYRDNEKAFDKMQDKREKGEAAETKEGVEESQTRKKEISSATDSKEIISSMDEAKGQKNLDKVDEAFKTLSDHFAETDDMKEHLETLNDQWDGYKETGKIEDPVEVKKSVQAIDDRIRAQKLLHQAGSDLRKYLANKMGLPDTQLEKVAEVWDLSKIKKLQKQMQEEKGKLTASEGAKQEAEKQRKQVGKDPRKEKKELKLFKNSAYGLLDDHDILSKEQEQSFKKDLESAKTDDDVLGIVKKYKLPVKKLFTEEAWKQHQKQSKLDTARGRAKKLRERKESNKKRDEGLDVQLSDRIRNMKPHEVDQYVHKLFKSHLKRKQEMTIKTKADNTCEKCGKLKMQSLKAKDDEPSLKAHKNNTDGAMYESSQAQDSYPPHEGEFTIAQVMKMMASVLERLQVLENMQRATPVIPQQEQPMGQPAQAPMGQEPLTEGAPPMEGEEESPFGEEGEESPFEEEGEETEEGGEEESPFAEESEEEEGEEGEEEGEEENPFAEESDEEPEEDEEEEEEEEDEEEFKRKSTKKKRSLEDKVDHLNAKMDELIGTDDDEDVVMKGKVNLGGEHAIHDKDKGEHEHDYDQQYTNKTKAKICTKCEKPMSTETDAVSTKADEVETKDKETKVSTKSADVELCECGKHKAEAEPTVSEKETKPSMKSDDEKEESLLTKDAVSELLSEALAKQKSEIFEQLGVKSAVTPITAVDGQTEPAGAQGEEDGLTLAEIVDHFSKQSGTPTMGQLQGLVESQGV